ncbi:hypothetical protein CRG98_011241 [Punica granatum]|uniref:Uncharacterized protein n=1 Tax=Punica granatum TaxID=22663 RepID=A0A2I0KJF7_PUNGR|nr:hypothetical protein CRG98_011241 [Punica granatum]
MDWTGRTLPNWAEGTGLRSGSNWVELGLYWIRPIWAVGCRNGWAACRGHNCWAGTGWVADCTNGAADRANDTGRSRASPLRFGSTANPVKEI